MDNKTGNNILPWDITDWKMYNEHGCICTYPNFESMLKEAIKTGTPLELGSIGGYFEENKLVEELKEIFGKDLIEIVNLHTFSVEEGKGVEPGILGRAFVVGDHSMVTIAGSFNGTGGSYITIGIASLKKGTVGKIKELWKIYREPEKDLGISVMSHDRVLGYHLRVLNDPGQKLIEENYSPKAYTQFQAVSELLRKDDPPGRLFLLTGPPGTGKTHMVRGFVADCVGQQFVIIPPHLVSHLADPDFLDFLVKTCEDSKKTTLIVEDADSLLENRAIDNMSSISTMLNFGSGILGNALDLRIIATSNTSVGKIDDALKRPGRLAAHLTLDKLTAEQALKALKKLVPDKAMPELSPGGTYTLAETYKMKEELEKC
jgi:hypothetical protein